MENLKFIDEQLTLNAVPYEFGEWTGKIQYPYFVGELPSPTEYLTEDGKEETTMFITGFHRGNAITLFEYAERIKSIFPPIFGLRAKTDNGGAIAVFFDGFSPIPTGEADFKKIEIHLKIKEWKGDA